MKTQRYIPLLRRKQKLLTRGPCRREATSMDLSLLFIYVHSFSSPYMLLLVVYKDAYSWHIIASHLDSLHWKKQLHSLNTVLCRNFTAYFFITLHAIKRSGKSRVVFFLQTAYIEMEYSPRFHGNYVRVARLFNHLIKPHKVIISPNEKTLPLYQPFLVHL